MGLHLPADLKLALPIVHIDSLGELVKLSEGWWLPDMGDLILDAIREAIVEVVLNSTFSVSLDLQSNPIELYDILCNSLTVLHGEVIKLMLGISYGVMWPKVGLELKDELSEIIHLQGMESGILHKKEVQLKPLEGHALQVQLHKGNFSVVGTKSLGAVLEVQLTLH